ncbi:shikimate dehydrogenase [Loigolactobacillus zhaoyuanensis]|uniref:Shikimate dehydrogenase (NADP(+)) n=1 Tax=Loigolactobacillus zhaoyuanensis TaxID=2486017 RepID=A0ABW8UFJ4_9LACO|nr:shikimate dehydrogenase [Loigolactobacillus zhaoyuanensis]
MIDGKTQLFGFFAHPAQHSLSPLMYNITFAQQGLNATYLAFDFKTDLAAAVASIRTLNFGGVNLSMPFKAQVLPLLDEVAPEASLIGAVNTIVNQNGHLVGHSTDGAGFFAGLAQQDQQFKQAHLTILGAGGAGLAIIAAAAHAGFTTVDVFKRQNSTYATVAAKLAKIAAATQIAINLHDYSANAELTAAIQQSDLLVNATNIGMGTSQELPLPLAVLKQIATRTVVSDVVYFPQETVFLKAARRLGCPTYNGLPMLIQQGALAFKLWTDAEMPIDQVTQALEQQLYQK